MLFTSCRSFRKAPFFPFLRQFHNSYDQLFNPVPPETVEDLRRYGYAILDNFVSEQARISLLKETHQLLTTKFATRNKTHFVPVRTDGVTAGHTASAVEKSAVEQVELSLVPSQVALDYPTLSAIHHGTEIAAQANVFWPRLTLREQAVKAQVTQPRGAFPIHVDAAAGHDNRIVTAIIYPHTQWPESHAGALRLYPTPLSSIDILPEPGRLVLFSSCLLHHQVLPTNHSRTSVTVWMSGSIRNVPDSSIEADVSQRLQAVFQMLTPRFRDVVFKLLLLDEWTLSLQQSHDTEHASVLVNNFRRDIAIIRDRLPAALHLALKENDELSIEDIAALLKTPQTLQGAFSELEAAIGQLPFLW